VSLAGIVIRDKNYTFFCEEVLEDLPGKREPRKKRILIRYEELD